VAINTVGNQWLGHNPRNIEHLKLANGRLGHMGLGQGMTYSLDTASSA